MQNGDSRKCRPDHRVRIPFSDTGVSAMPQGRTTSIIELKQLWATTSLIDRCL